MRENIQHIHLLKSLWPQGVKQLCAYSVAVMESKLRHSHKIILWMSHLQFALFSGEFYSIGDFSIVLCFRLRQITAMFLKKA